MPQRRPGQDRQLVGLAILGAGFLAASAAIHLDLYVTGYRSISTIGWLFLLQVITGFGLAAALVVSRGLARRLVAALGVGFALSTLGGYLLSVWIGLFGFKEVRTTSGLVAGFLEVLAAAALAALAQGVLSRAASVLVAAVSIGATALLGVAVALAVGPTSSSAQQLETRSIAGVTVVTNAKGFTLYWFAPDTPTRSTCYGACAAYWPPAGGAPGAGHGVTGTIGTITRTDGSIQAIYQGHPLYTYIADTAPGQANGNNIDLNGGRWFEVTPSGRAVK